MGLGNTAQNRIFLGIANGKITRKTGTDTPPETFGFVEGSLKSIARRKVDIKGVMTEFIDFNIEDGGEDFNLSVQSSGSIARGIILSLASVESFVGNRVRISPYLSKDGKHTNVTVHVNGQKVSWVTAKIPSVEKKQFGSNVVIDDSKRMEFINAYIADVTQKVALATATPQAHAQQDIDIDDDADMDVGDAGWMADGGNHM